MRTSRITLTTLVLTCTAAFGLSACGGSGGDSTATPAATIAKDDALAAAVPDKVKQVGHFTVGVDPTYAPNEMLASDGRTVEGMNVDILDAVAAKLGVKNEWRPAQFDTILLGVDSGRFDLAMSSFTINPDRLKSVDMVSYYDAGTLWAVKKGNPNHVDPKNLCGLSIGVQKGTVQNNEMNVATKKCTDEGKPAINLVVDDQQSKITAALTSDKVIAMAADSPITLYAVQQTGGTLEKLGEIYDSAPYGVVVPKGQAQLADAVAKALTSLKESGDYERILKKWGNEAGAISEFKVNPTA